MKVIYAPDKFRPDGAYIDIRREPMVFLAGSIEMGEAEDWQDEVIKEFKNAKVTFLNPRRNDWDSSWEQSIENEQFREQVEWELNGLEYANIIFLYFHPDTKAPISLLELGLHANSDARLIVCCPDGFYRKGNVDIVCDQYNLVCLDTLERAKGVLEAFILTWDKG